jgi:hypothetical protein
MRFSSFILLSAALGLVGCGDDDATPGDDAGTGSDAGTPVDSGTPPVDSGTPIDSGTPVDSGTPPADAGSTGDGVRCVGAAADCTAGQICCSGPVDTECLDPGTMCMGQSFVCDGTEDCPGERCCGSGSGTECLPTCTGFHICHTAAECGDGESCCPNGGGVPGGTLMHCMALPAGTSCPLPP